MLKQKTHHHIVPKSLWDLHSAAFTGFFPEFPINLISHIRPRMCRPIFSFFRKMLSISRFQTSDCPRSGLHTTADFGNNVVGPKRAESQKFVISRFRVLHIF